MLEGLTLAQPLPIPGPPPLVQTEDCEGEGEDALEFADLVDEVDAEHADPPLPDLLIACPAPQPVPPPQDATQPEVTGTSPLQDKASSPKLAEGKPALPPSDTQIDPPAEGADAAEGPAAPRSGGSGLWRMVQNLRSIHENPTQPDAPAADMGPGAAPLLVADPTSPLDMVPPPAATDASEPRPLTPRSLPDQILTGLRPHLSYIAPQLAPLADQAIQSQDADRIEIRLDPEELGRVQFTLQAEGDSLRVIIAVERPETLDLLRRHADLLTQSLRDAGYGGASLCFSTGEDGGADRRPTQPPVITVAEQDTPPPPQIAAESGLNLLF